MDVHNQLIKSVGCQVEKVKKRSKYCQTSLKENKSVSTSVVKMVDARKINNLFCYLSCIRALMQDFHLKGEDGLNLTSQKRYLLTVINVFNATFCLFFWGSNCIENNIGRGHPWVCTGHMNYDMLLISY